MAVVNVDRGAELGQGLYSLSDLRAFVALSGAEEDGGRVPYWLGSVLLPVGHRRWRPDYSFGDLISLFVVREFQRKGLKRRVIREAEDWLRKSRGLDRPFVLDDIKTDGVGIYVDDRLIAGQIESADRHGQQVLRELVKDRLESVHYHDGIAACWTPEDHVLVDPRVQFGEPVIAGTRIPTSAIADMASYAELDEIAVQMGISPRKARAAFGFERRLAAARN